MQRKLLWPLSIVIGAIVLIVGGYLLFSNPTQGSDSIDSKYGAYVYAYTSGTISKTSDIKLVFANEQVDKSKVGEALEEDVFSFDPYIEGTSYWEGKRTIKFKPKEHLTSAEKYQATFHLYKIIDDLTSELSEFRFSFKTLYQGLEVNFEGLRTSGKDLKYVSMKGNIQSADIVDYENVKKIMEANYRDESYTVKWTQGKDKQHYQFTIDSIPRLKDEVGQLTIHWDGEPIGLDKANTRNFSIPELGAFQVTQANVMQTPDQHLRIVFSDPLDQSQNFQGLVQIDNARNYRFISNDNVLKVYPDNRLTGKQEVEVSEGIKNVIGENLESSFKRRLAFTNIKPQLELIGEGNILPDSKNGFVLPFKAVGLEAVDVQVVKVFENNILQFLQVNNMSGGDQLKRVGKPVLEKTIALDDAGISTFNQWNRFTLDLSNLIDKESGAIYRVGISFRKQHSVYPCEEEESEEESDNLASVGEAGDGKDEAFWDNFSDRYYGNKGYYYRHEDEPCHVAYYGGRRAVFRNVFASDIGLISKSGKDDELRVFATDLKTTEPISGAKLKVHNYQNQLLKKGKTNDKGMAKMNFADDEEPFLITASADNNYGYLKVDGGSALSLSRFNIDGVAPEEGVKGYIYGERGVWRPGDSVFLNFILEDPEKNIPRDHPIVMELHNARGQLVKREVKPRKKHNLYTFRLKTRKDDPTGNWEAKIKVGNHTFTKTVRIETIRPNRLKINLSFGKKTLSAHETNQADLKVEWLHGAKAGNIETKVDAYLSSAKPDFDKFSNFSFLDPSREFNSTRQTVFESKLDDEGKARFQTDFSVNEAPGPLNVKFHTKAFEPGGGYSTGQKTMPYHPYQTYLGINVPEGDGRRGMLEDETTYDFPIVAMNKDGEKVRKKVAVTTYRIRWRWWWHRSEDDLSDYAGKLQEYKKDTDTVIVDGEGTYQFKADRYGRYLVRACDLEGGHCTGEVFYVSGYYGSDGDKGSQAPAMLSFTSDKNKYQVGEEVSLKIPGSGEGRYLVSLEDGSGIVKTFWEEADGDENTVQFKVTEEMTPNIYAHVTLIQPHENKNNDLPLRMYGAIPIKVEDPKTKLAPQISMADEIRPLSSTEVSVSEADGRPMTYTVAMVDEGLLDLTSFTTPNPWGHFYSKEALAVKTWDLYDDVIGAFNGQLDNMLSVGGGVQKSQDQGGEEVDRFEPMVRFLGPFQLSAGEEKTHTIDIPRYIGSVKTMVVARQEQAYGNTHETTPVKKPLMVKGALPRVLGPGETVDLPVTVFAMEDNIGRVNLKLETNKMLDPVKGATKTVDFNEKGQKVVDFALKSIKDIGKATVKIHASSGNESASYQVELKVRNPNHYLTEVTDTVIKPGESWQHTYDGVGMPGTNSGYLEASRMPPMDLGKRVEFLIKYPHGCIEQTTSLVFSQLFLDNLTDLSNQRKAEIDKNIKGGIQRLKNKFTTSSGGFAYWPGKTEASEWGSNYAGHFILEASQKGYSIPSNMLNNWEAYQRKKAQSWDENESKVLTQAYRLYTLSLAGSPAMGAMNKLRREGIDNATAKLRLAAAYHLSGQKGVARKLVNNTDVEVPNYRELHRTYGSGLRDRSMILETYTLMGNHTKAMPFLKTIANAMGANKWRSTHSTGFGLLALGKFAGGNNMNSKQLDLSLKIGDQPSKPIQSDKFVAQNKLPFVNGAGKPLKVTNNTKGPLRIRLIRQGKPITGKKTDASNSLELDIQYVTMTGDKLNPAELPQGKDFVAEATVKHPGGRRQDYHEMALEQVFPSGWQIVNTRLLNVDEFNTSDKPEYRDIRDDRVYTYFDLNSNESKTFRVVLNASFKGRFYLPSVYAKAMYDETINARKHGQWVEVVDKSEYVN